MSQQTQFEHVRPVRLYQRIVEQIEEAIAKGELRPGSRLPSERELVVQFGTSRPTVREALRVLESNGLVRSRPGDPNGPEILPYSSDGLQKQLARLMRAEGMTMAELISFRMILDGSGAHMAALLHTPDQLAELESTIVAMQDAIELGNTEFSMADVAFHDAVARASRNAIIGICNQVVRSIVLSLITSKVVNAQDATELMRESLDHHREVLDAIRAGDSEGASRISRRNLFDYYNGYVTAEDRPTLLAMLDPRDRAERTSA